MLINKTKIIATIGPASSDEKILEGLIEAGVNVCRLNFSHGTHEEYKKVIKAVRSINKKKNLNTAILGDLQGPKLRIGDVENGEIELYTGNEITLVTTEIVGTQKHIYVNYPKLSNDIEPGNMILIDDGKIILKAIEIKKKAIKAKIIQGGVLTPNKGVNLPNSEISMPCLTAKDLIDLSFILENNLEWIALSFVRSPEDILKVQKIVARKKKKIKGHCKN